MSSTSYSARESRLRRGGGASPSRSPSPPRPPPRGEVGPEAELASDVW
eukprot:CAMPEP_0185363054 /NCGR_PEP_ID=MMETSP1364-20130426/11454_1 /TAXON_ID=38817 /ORGANISM="Gephyrocapsa oceanica, Strain RCC1303" /LENGTH=47 /DNA_ID= /DNA_START= /DNA_END= /DNA_ORIENTATION=